MNSINTTQEAIESIRKSGSNIFNLNPELMKDKQVITEITKLYGPLFYLADASLKKDKDFVISILSIYGENLRYVSPDLKSDPDVVKAAIKQSASSIQYADDSLRNNKRIASLALSYDGTVLKYLNKELAADKSIVMTAVSNNGYALEYASDNLKADYDIIMAACKHNKNIIMNTMQSGYSEAMFPILQMVKLPLVYANHSTIYQKKMAMELVEKCGINIKYLNEELQNDKDVARLAILENPWAICFSGPDVKKDSDIVALAVSKDPDIFRYSYISELLPINAPSLDQIIKKAEDVSLNNSRKKNSVNHSYEL